KNSNYCLCLTSRWPSQCPNDSTPKAVRLSKQEISIDAQCATLHHGGSPGLWIIDRTRLTAFDHVLGGHRSIAEQCHPKHQLSHALQLAIAIGQSFDQLSAWHEAGSVRGWRVPAPV